MKKVFAAAFIAALYTGTAQAGTIERACLSAKRPGSTALCGCIQAVADRTLNLNDQRLAAQFFADPHKAQVIRQSSKSSDSRFWEKYKVFGATAQHYCG